MHLARKLLACATLVAACAGPATAAALIPEAMFAQLAALADTGNPEVKYNLGMFYNNGYGTKQDNKTAFRYFSEAAEAGSLLAAYKVGCYYASQFPGVVPLDPEAALRFKLRAAEGGYDLAQHDVAIHLGRKGDRAAAFMWWEKASRQGNMGSTAYLAHHFTRGAAQDKVRGVALMLVLKGQMPSPTKELVEQLAAAQATMSAEEALQAEQLRASWITGPTPLTLTARAGAASVPALITSLKQ